MLVLTRKQDQKTNLVYAINGALYIYKKELVLKSENYVWGEKVIPLIMSNYHSLDVDEEEDFKIAEQLIKKNIV